MVPFLLKDEGREEEERMGVGPQSTQRGGEDLEGSVSP